MADFKGWLSRRILSCLQRPTRGYAPFFAPPLAVLRNLLQPGDVLLVEGNTRLSAMIKFLTQSTWSHAALFTGPSGRGKDDGILIEAEADAGVIESPLAKYTHFNTRVCRPIGLAPSLRDKVIAYARARIGWQYDSRQVMDLARFLLPLPPVPVPVRRRLIAVGSGDPTKAICSTLIGEAFASVAYPILPDTMAQSQAHTVAPYVESENRHIRRHGLYTPRDFDVSPFFAVVKPPIPFDAVAAEARQLRTAHHVIGPTTP